MSFSLKKLAKKSIKFVAASLVAVVLSGVSIHMHQSTIQTEQVNKSVISFSTQITGMAYAADETPKPASGSTDSDAFTLGFVKFLNTLLVVMYALLIPLISLAGWLLSPDWVMGDIFNLRPVFHNLWILVSNVVYVIFAFILIAMAFMNIFGSGNKAYEIKSALPKLIVGIIMVPFTWFIVSGIVSVTSILTASVLQLPAKAIEGTPGASYLDKIYVPNTVYVNFTGSGGYGTGKVDEGGQKSDTGAFQASGYMYSLDCSSGSTAMTSDNKGSGDSKCLSIKQMLNGQGAYSVLFAYAYGIFNVQDFQQISTEELAKSLKSIGDVSIKLLFSVVVFLALGVIVIALVAALFMRAITLWVYAIFSPVFALGYFFDNKIPGLDKMKTVKMTISELIGLAMVPVVVSAGLAFGLMFLSLAINAKIDGNSGSVGTISNSNTGSIINIGGLKLISIGTPNEKQKSDKSDVGAALDFGKSLIGKVIIDFLAIVLLWMIVQAALKTSDITAKVAEPIFKFGTDMAKAAPILPKGMGGSIGGMERAGTTLRNIPNDLITDQYTKSGLDEKTKTMFGIDHSQYMTKARELEKRNVGNNQEAAVQQVKELLGTINDPNMLTNRVEATRILKQKVRQLKTSGINIDEGLIKRFEDATTVGAMEDALAAINKALPTDRRLGTWISQQDLHTALSGGTVGGASTPPATPTAGTSAAAPVVAGATALAVTGVSVTKPHDGARTVILNVGTEKVTVKIDKDKKATIAEEHQVDGQVPEVSQIQEQLGGLKGTGDNQLTDAEIQAVATAVHTRVKKKEPKK